jgi:hypothetical protein
MNEANEEAEKALVLWINSEAERLFGGDWRNQRSDHEQQRWEYLFAAGLVSEAEANAWADEVWGESGDASE